MSMMMSMEIMTYSLLLEKSSEKSAEVGTIFHDVMQETPSPSDVKVHGELRNKCNHHTSRPNLQITIP